MDKTIIKLDNVNLGYRQQVIVHRMNLTIERGKVYTIIGPNGSGKSTIMKTLSRNLKPLDGQVYLGQERLFSVSSKELARKMATLNQKPHAPEDLTVQDLVEHGRFPHRRLWRQGAADDRKIVNWALEQTGLTSMAGRKLDSLSGGEGQRAWVAMALAQQPEILLLDEPTTYLDINHQLEMLQLVKKLNGELGITVIMILHDISHAIHYSDEIYVIKNGEIYAHGSPNDVICEKMFHDVFSVAAEVFRSDKSGKIIYEITGLSREEKAYDGKASV